VTWEALPRRFNPPEGMIVTANNRVADDDYPYLISTSYAVPYRAARIIELLAARPRHALLEKQSWCDDVTTPAVERCDDLLARWQSGVYIPMRVGDGRE
jgi:acyl-homoserine lactone acylase PvdQ